MAYWTIWNTNVTVPEFSDIAAVVNTLQAYKEKHPAQTTPAKGGEKKAPWLSSIIGYI